MQPNRALPLLGTLLAMSATIVIVTGSATPHARAAAQSANCVASAPTLDDAKDAYATTCSAPRVDCDPIDGGWTCSSGVIGDAAPGGTTPDPTPPEAAPEEPSPEPTNPPADNPGVCTASAATLEGARAAYAAACAAPRVDCDSADDAWTCSSASIPDTGPSNPSSRTGEVTQTPEPTSEPTPTDPAPDRETGVSDPVTQTPIDEGTPEPLTAPEPEPTTETTPESRPELTADEPEPARIPGSPSEPGGDVVRQTYAPTDGPDDNPMKGWSSGWWGDRPEASVGFQYIKWSDLEPTNGNFDFDAVEDIIARPGSQDRHLILRLYCDWWGESATSDGCPDWIFSDVGVKRLQGDNGRYITDYNDPRFIDEAVEAIEALAARYDDDPRMYTFELGIIGYWGEWHTWGSQIDGSPYEITEKTEQRILDAYLNSFDRVRVMARYPDRSIMTDATQVGFHNDYFRPNNNHSAEFDASVDAGARWLQGPIGGEIPPGLSANDYNALYATTQGAEMIATGRYSTMKPGAVADQYQDEHMALHRQFGYTYQIESATYSTAQSQDGTTNVALAVSNVGVAPFYYNWDVQFGLIDDDGSLVAVADAAPYDLRDGIPGTTFNLAGAVDLDGVATGDYELAVRIVQPGADDAKSATWSLDARNTYVLFANEIAVIDGEWDNTNALTGGWSILGTTSVS